MILCLDINQSVTFKELNEKLACGVISVGEDLENSFCFYQLIVFDH